MRLLIFSLGLLGRGVKAQDQFFQTPSFFAFDHDTQFYWTDGQGTFVLKLSVKGDTDPTESIQLPLTNCNQTQNNVCVRFNNNGTGRFGGAYAKELRLSNVYHFNLVWISTDGTKTGNSSSSVFTMIDPIVSIMSSSPSSSSSSSSLPSSASSSQSSGKSTSSSSSSSTTTPSSTTITIPSTYTSRTYIAVITVEITTVASLTSTPTSTGTDPGGTSTSTTPVPLPTTQRPISSSEKAGIAVGAISGASLIFAILFSFFRRSRDSHRQHKNTSQLITSFLKSPFDYPTQKYASHTDTSPKPLYQPVIPNNHNSTYYGGELAADAIPMQKSHAHELEDTFSPITQVTSRETADSNFIAPWKNKSGDAIGPKFPNTGAGAGAGAGKQMGTGNETKMWERQSNNSSVNGLIPISLKISGSPYSPFSQSQDQSQSSPPPLPQNPGQRMKIASPTSTADQHLLSSSMGAQSLARSGGTSTSGDQSVYSSDTGGARGAGIYRDGHGRRQEMTPEQIRELEEEERRIDAAIRESERLMELRRQREELQARIKGAKGGVGGARGGELGEGGRGKGKV